MIQTKRYSKFALYIITHYLKNVDLQSYLVGDVFGELRDMNKFIQYGLTRVTIE